jgi:hypothetical protein
LIPRPRISRDDHRYEFELTESRLTELRTYRVTNSQSYKLTELQTHRVTDPGPWAFE